MIFDRLSSYRRTAAIHSLILMMGLVSAAAQAQGRDNKLPPLLTDEDIELIKVYEVDLKSDPPPRIVIPRDELREFVKEYQPEDQELRGKANQEKFLRSKGHIQLGKLFEHKARDYYKHVRVRSQIESLRNWGNIHRRYIHGFFQPTFATGAVPELYLFPRGRETDKIEMTNFYILTQVTVGGKPIIDRNQPEESLLVQWGLPRDAAKFPAPEADGWEPKFKSVQDERFVEHVDWIKSLIAANQDSTLGIQYKVPRHKTTEDN